MYHMIPGTWYVPGTVYTINSWYVPGTVYTINSCSNPLLLFSKYCTCSSLAAFFCTLLSFVCIPSHLRIPFDLFVLFFVPGSSYCLAWRVCCATVPLTLESDLPTLINSRLFLLLSVSQSVTTQFNVSRMENEDGHWVCCRCRWVERRISCK